MARTITGGKDAFQNQHAGNRQSHSPVAEQTASAVGQSADGIAAAVRIAAAETSAADLTAENVLVAGIGIAEIA